MQRRKLNFGGAQWDFVFPFGAVHCQTDRATGLLPGVLRCVRWGTRSEGPRRSWEQQTAGLIDAIEQSQVHGNLEHVSAALPALDRRISDLQRRIAELRELLDRAQAIRARHEPSAGDRQGW